MFKLRAFDLLSKEEAIITRANSTKQSQRSKKSGSQRFFTVNAEVKENFFQKCGDVFNKRYI